jgi:hypothetical protein
MSAYHTGLVLVCEEVKCTQTETFINPGAYSDSVLEDKATKDRGELGVGWYIPPLGKRLCPMHHKALAEKMGKPTLYHDRTESPELHEATKARILARKESKNGQ